MKSAPKTCEFCSCRYPVSPRHPFDGTLHSQNIARLWLGRAGEEKRLSSRYSETRFPPLDPPWLENISTVAMQPKFADAKEFSSRLRELRRPLYRSVALGKHTTGRLKQNSPLPFLLANAHVASCGWLGIHEADLQAFGFGTALPACHASKVVV